MDTDSKVVAAYNKQDNSLVLVATNVNDSDTKYQFDLSGFGQIGKKADATAVRTSGSLDDGENWADVTENADIMVDTSAKTLSATLKANSITTFIIKNVKLKSATVKVKFDLNGGTKVSFKSITVKRGTKLGQIPTATKKRYKFLGWYTKKKGGKKITKNTVVNENKTFYAHWKKK